MRIFNKFIESKKEPSNKNDIWFDGSVFRIYKEEEWQAFTVNLNDANEIAKLKDELYEFLYDEAKPSVEEAKQAAATIQEYVDKAIDALALSQQSLANSEIAITEATALKSQTEQLIEQGNIVVENANKATDNANEISSNIKAIWDELFVEINNSIASANEAAINANTAAETIDSKVESLQTLLDNHDTLIEDLQENKADKDGVYSGMTVGRSIDLLGVEDVEEGSFLFRPTDGDGSIKDGVAVVKSVKGDSVVWNQLYKPREAVIGTQTIKGVTFTVTSDGSVTAQGTAEAATNASAYIQLTVNQPFLSSHIYMLVAFGAPAGRWSYMGLYFGGIGNINSLSMVGSEGYKIFSPPADGVASLVLSCWGGQTIDCSFRPQFYDLTKMFGVGNEPSTIEEFNARVATLCIEDMNAYNEGEVVNMKASAIKSVGFNAWDEEWEVGKININDGSNINTTSEIRSKNYSKVLPSTEYYIETPNTIWIAFLEYDADKNYLRNRGGLYGKIKTSPDCHYLRFYVANSYGTTYNHDICINLVHSGYRNGEYEPYVEDVLALPTLDLFPNGMNRIGDVYDEYDSEKSVQRIGIRPYQSGDESIENVLTDGTSTLYVLEEPIVTPHDYRLAYKAWDFGTEHVIADGNTTAMTAGIIYEFNARDTIRSNKTRLDVLEPIVAGKIDKEADDYYPQLAVGLADNLAGVDVVDSEINFRRSGGGAISDGVARIEAIKGNSVVWNQVYPTGWSFTREGITITSQNNIITANGTLTTTYFGNSQFVGNEVNHKYLFIVEGLSSALNGANFSLQNRPNNGAIISNGFAYFFHDNSDPSLGRNIGFSRLTSGAVISETYILRQIDLTKMFQAGNEPTTIEEFYARIPMGVDLNAYNEGEVIHMDVQSIESQGVNAWDEEWEVGVIDANGRLITDDSTIRSRNFCPCLPNTLYYVGIANSTETNRYYLNIVFYDKEKKHISSTYANKLTITSPNNAEFFKICSNTAIYVYGSTYKNDICINISDTSINGKYFPYIKRVEDLSIIRKYFPNGMKSAGTAHDEIRYNKASGKKEYSKGRLKSVDMGTLNWTLSSTYPSLFYAKIADIRPSVSNGVAGNILTSKYVTLVRNNIHDYDKSCALDNVYNIFVKDSAYTDVASFKAAMQGVILYYESNDWEWVELDAEDQFKDLDYQVWNCGTEKAIAEGKSAPLAADITYGFNAIGKIKELEEAIKALQTKVASL